MQDFDAVRKAKRKPLEERTFRIGGEVFVARAENHPDVLANYDRITDETSIGETLQIVDEILEQMLEPQDEAVARYQAVRARTDDIVTVDDLLTLVTWLMKLQTGADDEAEDDPAAPAPARTMTPGPVATRTVPTAEPAVASV